MSEEREKLSAEEKQRYVNAADESIRLFSNACRSKREKYVVELLLRNAQIQYAPDEIDAREDGEVDVFFRDARFQVKEIMDPNRRRGDEAKKHRDFVESIEYYDQLLESFTPLDLLLSDVLSRVGGSLEGLAGRYGVVERQRVDLLFYVNLLDRFGLERDVIVDPEAFEHFGWRSVSFVHGGHLVVLAATDTAPEFLRERVGIVGSTDDID